MINIFLASLTVGIGSYLLRRGNILELLIVIFKKNNTYEGIYFAIAGIILNLLGIYFWQASYKSNLSYAVAISLYLSLTLIVSLITSAFVEKTQINLNFFLGTIFVVSGIVILSSNRLT